jgi:hypothetical protein
MYAYREIAMRQPEDTKTIDLLPTEKRGRGRPKLENAMSPAERARLYRQRKKSRPAAVVSDLEIDKVRREAADWRGMAQFLVDARLSKQRIPGDVMARIMLALSKA